MKVTHFEKGIWIDFENYKNLEITWNWWDPRKHIGFQRSIEAWFAGDHAPQINISLCWICVSFYIEFYDSRHEDERQITSV